MTSITVSTIGDSTLDNLYWMIDPAQAMESAKQSSVEGQLKERLNATGDDCSYEVESYAYDGFTTKSLLEGDTVGAVLPEHEKLHSYLQEKVASLDETIVYPLKDLKDRVEKAPDTIHYVVLSVGGNDFRVNLGNPIALFKDIPQIQKRYLEIMENIQNLKGKNVRPILMLQYRPDANNDQYGVYQLLSVVGKIMVVIHVLSITAIALSSFATYKKKVRLRTGAIFALISGGILTASSRVVPLKVTQRALTGHDIGMSVLGNLMEKFYEPILQQAKEDGIPVLDLANTFHPYHPLYTCGIEPGPEGGALIAEGIDHIVKNHDYTEPSKIYSKSPGNRSYTSAENAGANTWEVHYLSR